MVRVSCQQCPSPKTTHTSHPSPSLSRWTAGAGESWWGTCRGCSWRPGASSLSGPWWWEKPFPLLQFPVPIHQRWPSSLPWWVSHPCPEGPRWCSSSGRSQFHPRRKAWTASWGSCHSPDRSAWAVVAEPSGPNRSKFVCDHRPCPGPWPCPPEVPDGHDRGWVPWGSPQWPPWPVEHIGKASWRWVPSIQRSNHGHHWQIGGLGPHVVLPRLECPIGQPALPWWCNPSPPFGPWPSRGCPSGWRELWHSCWACQL